MQNICNVLKLHLLLVYVAHWAFEIGILRVQFRGIKKKFPKDAFGEELTRVI